MDPNFFAIQTSTENSKIGKVYPQVDGMGNSYYLRKPNSVWEIKNYSQLDFLPDLDFFKISNSAKLTDFISTGLISASGFLVSDKVKRIFDQYTISKHCYYPARLKYKMDFYENYFWLHFIENDDNAIDLPKSTFVLTDPLPFFRQEKEQFTFDNKEEAIIVWKNNNTKSLFPSTLTLRVDNQDFFSFSFLYHHNYISSRLIEHLEKDKVSGFDILDPYL